MPAEQTTQNLTPVPSHVRDLNRCQAVVLCSAGRQCTSKAITKRDSHPVCNTHKKARRFVLWTPLNLMSPIDTSRLFTRVMEEFRHGKISPVRLVEK